MGWQVAAKRSAPTFVLEDDAQFVFARSGEDLGQFSGKLLTERLCLAMKDAPPDFDVLYLGWSGWRGGNFKHLLEEDAGDVIRKVEYVWTTVAYIISPAAAKKLLAAGCPINQPVDNFMAWEASQGRLKSFVILDEGDEDGLWAGGICDQADFQGDSDIKKSDGGVQGDDAKEFAVPGVATAAAAGDSQTNLLDLQAFYHLPEFVNGKRVLLATSQAGVFLVDNSELNADAPGIGYRNAPRMEDRAVKFVPWGSKVEGVLSDGWLKFGA